MRPRKNSRSSSQVAPEGMFPTYTMQDDGGGGEVRPVVSSEALKVVSRGGGSKGIGLSLMIAEEDSCFRRTCCADLGLDARGWGNCFRLELETLGLTDLDRGGGGGCFGLRRA